MSHWVNAAQRHYVRIRAPHQMAVSSVWRPMRDVDTGIPGVEAPRKGRPAPRVPSPSRRERGKRRSRSGRSEEHTSELQSHLNIVCRLLLEKKKVKAAATAFHRSTSVHRRDKRP